MQPEVRREAVIFPRRDDSARDAIPLCHCPTREVEFIWSPSLYSRSLYGKLTPLFYVKKNFNLEVQQFHFLFRLTLKLLNFKEL